MEWFDYGVVGGSGGGGFEALGSRGEICSVRERERMGKVGLLLGVYWDLSCF